MNKFGIWNLGAQVRVPNILNFGKNEISIHHITEISLELSTSAFYLQNLTGAYSYVSAFMFVNTTLIRNNLYACIMGTGK